MEEANLAFVLNMRTFEELDVLNGDATAVRPLALALATLAMPVKKDQKCPFAGMGGMGGMAAHGALGKAAAALHGSTQAAVSQAKGGPGGANMPIKNWKCKSIIESKLCCRWREK